MTKDEREYIAEAIRDVVQFLEMELPGEAMGIRRRLYKSVCYLAGCDEESAQKVADSILSRES
jgi:hypothetical protein